MLTSLVGLHMQVASIGDVSACTYASNTAGSDGPAVYAFNCAGRIFNNAFANQPVNAVRVKTLDAGSGVVGVLLARFIVTKAVLSDACQSKSAVAAVEPAPQCSCNLHTPLQVAIDHSIGFTERSLVTGTITVAALGGAPGAAPGLAAAPGATAAGPSTAAAGGTGTSGASATGL